MSDEVTEPGPEESVRCRLCTAERSCGGHGLCLECVGSFEGTITGRTYIRDPEPFQDPKPLTRAYVEIRFDFADAEAKIVGSYAERDAETFWKLYNAFGPVDLPCDSERCD